MNTATQSANQSDRKLLSGRSLEDRDRAFSVQNAGMLAFGVFVVHVLTNLLTPYGFHRDEFLYLAMGEHLRLWRMDFPPFIAIVARVSHALFGESLVGIRLAPALAHAGLVYAAAFATALFGGRRSAQMLAALSVALSPMFLRAGAMLQPVVFDQLWWTLALVGLALRIRDDDLKHWTGTGLFLGLAALTKFSVAFVAAGFVVALLVTSLRRDLLTKWPWIALIIATLIGHPSITGQLLLGWPVRGQFDDLRTEQLSHVSPISFVTGQFSTGPLLFLAILGMVWLFRSSRASGLSLGSDPKMSSPAGSDPKLSSPMGSDPKLSLLAGSDPKMSSPAGAGPGMRQMDFRPIGVVTATAFLILLAIRGKAYYIAPIYPMLVAAGAAALDQLALRLAPKRPTKVLAVAAAIVALYGMLTLPFGLPLLAPPDLVRISKLLGVTHTSNTGTALALPQDYADMLGWESLANMTALVWNALPPSDTANAILIGTNYGRAGALDFYGPSLGLPPAISPVGSYWFFGPGTKTGDVAVVPTSEPESLRKFYRTCSLQSQTNNPWGVAEERSVQVYVCRGANATIQEAWPSFAGQN